MDRPGLFVQEGEVGVGALRAPLRFFVLLGLQRLHGQRRGIRVRLAAYGLDHAVSEHDQVVSGLDQPAVVRREDERDLEVLLHPAHQRDDGGAGLAVEVGGGFVGDHELGLARQRPGDGHALPLAARQLPRAVVRPLVEPYGLQQPLDAALPPLGVHPGQDKRVFDVLECREHRDQIERLEDETDVLAAEVGEFVVGQAVDVGAGNRDLALVGPVQATQQVEQRRLAAARGAQKHREQGRTDGDVDPPQHGHRHGVHLIGLLDALKRGHSLGGVGLQRVPALGHAGCVSDLRE